MASGAVPTTFSTLKTWDSSLGFAKNIDFVRVSDMKSMKSSARKRVSIIRNSNPGQDIAELQPASPGSPLLGMIAFFLSFGLLFIEKFKALNLIAFSVFGNLMRTKKFCL